MLRCSLCAAVIPEQSGVALPCPCCGSRYFEDDASDRMPHGTGRIEFVILGAFVIGLLAACFLLAWATT